MTKEEYQEFYQKNKAVVYGVPLLVFVILLNQFVLKPSRDAKRRERLGIKEGDTVAAAPAAAGAPAAESAVAPSEPPPPLVWDPSSIPPIDPKVQAKLKAMDSYPYGGSRNVFVRNIRKEMDFFPVDVAQPMTEVEVTRPDISYHGFMRLGKEKVAILKMARRLMLTRAGQTLFNTPYQLQTILDDRVILADASENNKTFEVPLSQETAAAPTER